MKKRHFLEIIVILSLRLTLAACVKSTGGGDTDGNGKAACAELPAACVASLTPVESDCVTPQEPETRHFVIDQEGCSAVVASEDDTYNCDLNGRHLRRRSLVC